ncbi:transmembrane protein 17 [Tribolium castaneum]|uniref:Transmembrane protein 17-like Protein n=1 Tax=Tribolium castaneum TaxID=7070 RepID=A0A139WC55_TRICA|nr:PREDICTED: transmembrane protein 17-like isoform X1 [Tribolium castaneum]KYB25484.1 Transmembrane protein 17-like Protein [Tribolium castaneum]|eukprot:XP_008197614.1 PREDICTED: transmembrane protein 17-like isoform X1 [Tribolium castaneum]
MDWKETVTSVSDKVFPGLSRKIDNVVYGNEVMSNLPLQMSLYFNVIFAPFWMAILVLYLRNTYLCFSELYKFIIITVISTVFLLEMLRLYLGYKGNLEDKIPELAGFWMLSLLLQFPLQGLLLFNPNFKLHVIEIIVQSIMFVMLCIQLVSSYCALKFTAAQQAIYFRIMKLRSDVTLADVQERYRVNKK